MSPKCEGRITHVLVFTNQAPDRSKPTDDRWVMLDVDTDIPRDTRVDPQFQPQTIEQMRQQCDEELEEMMGAAPLQESQDGELQKD